MHASRVGESTRGATAGARRAGVVGETPARATSHKAKNSALRATFARRLVRVVLPDLEARADPQRLFAGCAELETPPPTASMSLPNPEIVLQPARATRATPRRHAINRIMCSPN